MNWPLLLGISLPLLLLALLLAGLPRLRRNPRGTLAFGLIILLARVYVRLCHRLRVEGLDNLRSVDADQGLIVVANHTAGLDPVLIQVTLDFEIRWMMARDMAEPGLAWFWRWLRVILVDRTTRDPRSLLAALRHVKKGGALGLFPEGFIERPPGELRPFRPGIGLLVTRCKCPVLPVVIEGTPQVDPAWASLFRLSRSRLRILPLIPAEALRFDDPEEATTFLQARFAEATGWSVGEERPTRPASKHYGLWGSVRGKRVRGS
ncbi:MAG: lysophospholipid acyltransferase family protein [Phycisphaerales bacterium JB038]